ncbi:MAG: ABC transporter ATP-binding protein [Armatimonadota bacterium]
MSELAIETHGLVQRFGSVMAVDGVDLQVPVGSVYGYLGRNGAGKTTTIQMLMGLIEPSAGDISVLGFDPFKQDVAMKRVVSYVPERVHMYDWMKVADLMKFGAGVHPNWDQPYAEELRRRLELPLDRKLSEFSRGMQGKAALMAALASHPKLLILDDPTLGLDAIVRREFMESIVGVLQEVGTTVFFSSHIIDDVERVADTIGILRDGKLIVQQRSQDLKQSVKRIIITMPDGVALPPLQGVLQTQGEGRQQALICEDVTEEALAVVRTAGATSVVVEDCSLEDIFIAYGRTPLSV